MAEPRRRHSFSFKDIRPEGKLGTSSSAMSRTQGDDSILSFFSTLVSTK
jgi:hypothetical protein